MKPFGMAPKRRRSGHVLPPSHRSVSVLAKKSPLKRSPFKRRTPGLSLGTSNLVDTSDQSCNIKVAVRVRPENEKEITSNARNIIDIVDERMLVFDPKEDSDDFFFHGKRQERRDLNKKVQKDHKFAFDCVFGPSSTNSDVFEGTTKDLIDVLFNGYNCSVFVYGATGSGKTHTMLGKENNPGITLKTAQELYKRIDELEEEVSCEVYVSYLEIYNENVFDLINPGTLLQVREDGKSGINIPGLSRHKPSGPDDLLRLLQFGNSNRTQHPTDANKESSRSHAVFQVFLKQKSRSSGLSTDLKVAKLSMIDLAGSERGSVTSSRGAMRFREGANINKSLLALGNCINALADGSKYIPYRNSKLTRLLKDSIGGNCRTVMISNISPSSLTYEDTYNTLKYADRAKNIKVRLKKNVVSVDFHVAQYAKIVEDLKVEIQQLKDKITGLEEENQALRNQLEEPAGGVAEIETNSEELLALRQKLSDYEERQKEFDDLKARLDAFEKLQQEEKSKPPVAVTNSLEDHHSASEILDEKQNRTVSEYRDAMLKNLRCQSDINLVELQKEFHGRKIKRCVAIVPSDTIYDAGTKKLQKFVENLERKKTKSKKKNHHVMLECQTLRQKLEEGGLFDLPVMKSELNHLKTEATNDHLKKVITSMYHEQYRTEELLIATLEQLKKNHLLLLSYGNESHQLDSDYQDLVSRIQCTRVQYRDSRLVETNEDLTTDRIGNFLAGVLDLEDGWSESAVSETGLSTKELNETVVLENHGSAVELPQDSETSDLDDEEEQDSQNVWRPPTPPKGSHHISDDTPPFPKLSSSFSLTKFATASTLVLPSKDDDEPEPISEGKADNENNNSPVNEEVRVRDDVVDPKVETVVSVTDKTFSVADVEETAAELKEAPVEDVEDLRVLPVAEDLISTTVHAVVCNTPEHLQSYDCKTPSEPSSMETSVVEDDLPSHVNLNSTIVIKPRPMDETVVISSTSHDDDRRTTFVLQPKFEDKENFPKFPAPVAKVSPMTSHCAPMTSQGGARPKSLKKTLPSASASNLKALLELKPPQLKHGHSAGNHEKQRTAATAVANLPSYMQLTAASRSKYKMQQSHSNPRSRSPLGDNSHEANLTQARGPDPFVHPLAPAGGTRPKMKKSHTTSTLRNLIGK